MVRSRLPVPPLLGLFGTLLMLSPELPGFISNVPFTDPGVQESLAAAVEKYNEDRSDSANYFKVLSLIKAQYQFHGWEEYRLLVFLVETRCKKLAGWKMLYNNIQKCEELPGIEETPGCHFNVIHRNFLLTPAKLITTICG